MKKIIVFLGMIFFTGEVYGACGGLNFNPSCRVASDKLGPDGQIVWQSSYCNGDFPYCNEYGDCCSAPDKDEMLSGCCNFQKQVRHEVKEITYPKRKVTAKAYLCCDRSSYGNSATYYLDENKKAHCCGGEVYRPNSETDKQCCNHQFNSDGSVSRYYATTEVKGAPKEETICCESYGTAPGKYKARGYWNGSSAQCCQGKVYKISAETYGCCEGSYGSGKTHKTVESVEGAPNGEEACCDIGTYGTSPKAYWNGSRAVCCKGEIYKNGVDENGNTIYACCDGDTAENPTHKKVSVPSSPNGEEACCDIETYGTSPKGYWNGSTAMCCRGEIYKNGVDEKGNTEYACCSGDTSENPTQRKVSILGSPNGEGACCDIATYGENPTAYWNVNSVQCCKGTAYTKVIDGVTYGVCCSEEIYGSNPSVYWNGKTGICCKNAFTEVQNRTDGAPAKVCCDHDVYGPSAEAYGSGTCCGSYERYNTIDSIVPSVDVCCKGIGETPYCAGPACGSTGCCPSGTSFSDDCTWVAAIDCWDPIKDESGWLKEIYPNCNYPDNIVGIPDDTMYCSCPDGYELETTTYSVSGCC